MAPPTPPSPPSAPSRPSQPHGSPARPAPGGARSAAWASLLLAGALLGWSYSLPTVEFARLLSEPEIYSIWGGIALLWDDGTPLLATIVFAFSMLFPVGKLLALAGLLSRRRPVAPRRSLLWIELLGKWSMLDVLVVGAFVGAIRLRLGPNLELARGQSHEGIVIFAAAIVLSMLATRLVARTLLPAGAVAPHNLAPRNLAASDPRRWHARLVSVAAALTLAGALSQPLFEVSKGFIFRNQVHLPASAWRMLFEHERVLGLTLLLLVVALPAARCMAALACRFGAATPRALRLCRGLDEWAMLDVFALALLIVWDKLDQLASTSLGAGFGLTLAAAALSIWDAALLRRDELS